MIAERFRGLTFSAATEVPPIDNPSIASAATRSD